ncbi:MAG: hypothetical protein FWG11_00440 [Promicromonosporaceae bacterium]|nr:hypothetical protein [Promicromonosporaceae bacterium]
MTEDLEPLALAELSGSLPELRSGGVRFEDDDHARRLEEARRNEHAPAALPNMAGRSGIPIGGGSAGNRYLLSNNSTGLGTHHRFNFGSTGDTALVGDWNGNGRDTISVWREGQFFINNGLGDARPTPFIFGRATDEPIAGNWNGSGADTVGVRRGNQFLLRNSNSAGNNDIPAFTFGQASDEVLVGDWNCNGIDTIGVRRGNRFYLRNSNSAGPADHGFTFGRATDQVLVGDWNGNGCDTIGVRRGTSFYLRNSLTTGNADVIAVFGFGNDLGIVGDWNGNGITTPGVRRHQATLASGCVRRPDTGSPRGGPAVAANARRILDSLPGGRCITIDWRDLSGYGVYGTSLSPAGQVWINWEDHAMELDINLSTQFQLDNVIRHEAGHVYQEHITDCRSGCPASWNALELRLQQIYGQHPRFPAIEFNADAIARALGGTARPFYVWTAWGRDWFTAGEIAAANTVIGWRWP